MDALKRHAPILGILLVAAGLRLLAITQTAIFDLGEGVYLADAWSKYTETAACVDLVQRKLAESAGGEELLLAEAIPELHTRLQGAAPFSAKHGFSYLIALVYAWQGFTLWAGNLVEAIFGILCVGMVYALMCRLTTVRAASIAAAMLALSAYHVYFSRNAFPQTSAMFFYLLALYLHLLAEQRESPSNRLRSLYWFGCGLACGLSFLTNFQVAGVLPSLAIIHTLTCLRSGSPQEGGKRFLLGGTLMAAGFALPQIAMEASAYPLILLFRGEGLVYPHGTYLELLIPRLTSHAAVPGHASGLVLFPFFFTAFEGYPAPVGAVIILLIGFWGLRKPVLRHATLYDVRLRPAIYLGVALAVPLLIFSLKTIQGSRMLVNCLPFFLCILAYAVDGGWNLSVDGNRVVRPLLAVVLGVMGLSSLWQSCQVMQMRPAFAELTEWMEENDVDTVAGHINPAMYQSLKLAGLKGVEYQKNPADPDMVPRFLVTDRMELWRKNYPDECRFIPEGAEPVASFQHQFRRIHLHTGHFPQKGEPIESIQWVRGLDLERARMIHVYALPASFESEASESTDMKIPLIDNSPADGRFLFDGSMPID